MKTILKWTFVAALVVLALTAYQCPPPPTPTTGRTPGQTPGEGPSPTSRQPTPSFIVLDCFKTGLESWMCYPYPKGWETYFKPYQYGYGFYWYDPVKYEKAPKGVGGYTVLVTLEKPISLQEYLDGMRQSRKDNEAFTDMTFQDTKVTVFGKEWDGYIWKGNYTMTETVLYTGLDTVVSYGQNQYLGIGTYAPVDRWTSDYGDVVDAILAEIPEPPEDWVYVPPELPPEERPMSGYMTTYLGVSMSYPAEWDLPEDPWMGEGLWLQGPEGRTGMVIWVWPAGDPAQMLDDWGADVLDGYEVFTASEVTDGDPVTVLGQEAPAKIAVGVNAAGEDVTAGATFVDRGGDIMQVMWYAPSDEWDGMQDVFAIVLDSIGAWKDYTSEEYSLFAVYPYAWPDPAALTEGEGFSFASADGKTAMEVRVHEGGDPAQMLADWEPPFADASVEDGESIYTLRDQWPTKLCRGKGTDGADVTCRVVFATVGDKVVEVLWYAPADDWEAMQEVLSRMVSMLSSTS